MASIHKSPMEKKLLELFALHAEPKGYRAVDVDCKTAGRSLVRFYIEKMAAEGPSPVSISDCAEVSRTMDPVLEKAFEGGSEHTEIPPGPYDLEVSSPGLDRRLRLSSDFEKAVGQEVRLKLKQKKESFGLNLQGILLRLLPSEEGFKLVLSISGREATVGLEEICSANLVWRPVAQGPKKLNQKK